MSLQFNDNSDEVKKALHQAVLKGVTKSVEIVNTQAVLNAPVDLGRLSQSINNYVDDNGDSIDGFVGTNVEYAIFVEKGTGEFAENGQGRKTPWTYQRDDGTWVTTTGQRPQPYLEPAFKDNVENIKKAIKDELGRID